MTSAGLARNNALGNSATRQHPVVDAELVDYLIRAFPVTLSPDYDIRNYDRMLGAQDVIRHLRMLWEDQNP